MLTVNAGAGREGAAPRLTEMGFDLVPQLAPEGMAAFHRTEHEGWSTLLRAARIRYG
ncbi:MAG: hypothetical protein IRZ13_02595 [Acetobacteraceae bacterium]|nr:hypothetical protein [Acetobacteraceae bacterium]